MSPHDKPIVWLHGEITTPPFSSNARIEAGYLLRQIQKGTKLSLPQSRPMPSIGPNCHELRINDENLTWRIIYRIYTDMVLILNVFEKKTSKTPKSIIDVCKQRLKTYEKNIKGWTKENGQKKKENTGKQRL
jgi:phage-related protein